MADGGYRLVIDKRQLQVLIERTSGPFQKTGPIAAAMGDVVRQWGVLVQQRAVRNVSGYPVIYSGGAFRVMVRTGTLKGAIEMQYPFINGLQARVFVNGSVTSTGEAQGGKARVTSVSAYAFRIEFGGDEIDLKKTMLGKTVPFFGVRSAASTGPYAARGLKPVDRDSTGYGSSWRSAELDAKLLAKGKSFMTFEKKGGQAAYKGQTKGASTYFISFRKVGKTGWIIPAAKPRPFMLAAVEGTGDQARRLGVKTMTQAIFGQ